MLRRFSLDWMLKIDTREILNVHSFLKFVERIGNKTPSVTELFIFVLIITAFISFIFSLIDFDYYLVGADGEKGEKIIIKNFLSYPMILDLLANSLNNFISFPPLALSLVVAFGIGIAESSGFLRVLLSKLSGITPKKLVVPMLLFISIACHIISDGAYLFIMPVAALLFLSAGKHPVAGIATSFAGLAGGFAASFTPSVIDPIMQLFTENASHIIDKNISINVLCNYFLSSFSVIFVILFCWFVCEKIVEPFLNENLPLDKEYDGFVEQEITPLENKALFWALSSAIVIIAFLIIASIPSDSSLRGQNGSLTAKDANLMKILVPLLFFIFAIPGFIFGKISGSLRDLRDTINAMCESLRPLGSFIVFCFICGQFLYVFNQSNLSKLIAVSGAEFLKSLALPPGITIFGIIIFVGFLNLFVTSATSKWAVLAPIFVPMLMLVGISPELTQAAFRVSDSAINVITPLFPFYPLIISYCQRYCKKTGVGTLVSIMIPYSIALMIALTSSLYLFWFLEIPLGFESSYTYIPNLKG